MRGDALASGSKSAKFATGEDKQSKDNFDEAVKDYTPPLRPVFCRCNAKGCEDFVAYSSKEFSDHVHGVHYPIPF